MTTYAFQPDYAVAPGATLKELLEENGMSQSELAIRMGMTEKTISQIVNGVAPISYETASKLELVVGVPAHFWNAREAGYREAILKRDEHERLASQTEWLKTIPCKELVSRKLITGSNDKGELARQVLAFFGVSDVEAWRKIWLKPQVQFRGKKAHNAHPGLVAAWLRMGELTAKQVDCEKFIPSTFHKALKEIRSLTVKPPSVWPKQLRSLCASAGVAVVLIPQIPSAGVSGITKWLTKDKAMIQLSLKYKTDDQFWFTFFHEACHVLKHSKKAVFYENGKRSSNPVEKEANAFARDILIPTVHELKFPFLKSKVNIKAFAASIGISPGIVVGRLQHDGFLDPKWHYKLKNKYDWNK